MSNKRKTEEYGKMLAELERRLEQNLLLRGKIISEVSSINSDYINGSITSGQKQEHLDRILDRQPYTEWIGYYDSDISKTREIISSIRSEMSSIESYEAKKGSRNRNMAIFMLLAFMFGFLIFAGMPEPIVPGQKSMITGFVVSVGGINQSYYAPSQLIYGNFTIAIVAGDQLPNTTNINVTLGGNTSQITIWNFILNSSLSRCYNYTSGTARDMNNTRTWEGIIGYGFGPNTTCTKNYTVNFTAFFPTGLFAPSSQGTYNITMNATYNTSTIGGENVLFSNIEFNVTEKSRPAISLSQPSNFTYNSSSTIVFSYTPMDNFTGLKNCSMVFDGVINSTTVDPLNNTLATFSFTNLEEKRYIWRINCTDNSTSYNTNESDIGVIFADRTVPTITIVAPANQTTTSNNYMNFSWNATDKISSSMLCNITMNGTVNNSAPLSQTNGTIFNFSRTSMPTGSYLWNITCWDNATNTNTTDIRQFNITAPSNSAPPATIIVGIMDNGPGCTGGAAWDKTANTTHMDYTYGPVLNWTNGTDPNGDHIKTRICIGTTTNVYLVDLHGVAADNSSTLCDVLNAWQNTSAVPGQWVNLTNTTFTYGGTNKTFYAMFMSMDDGTPIMMGNAINYTISIINTVPSGSTAFIAASTSAAKTHQNTTSETYKWTAATNTEDGSGADKCPADTMTHNATVGTGFGDSTYFGASVAVPATGFNLASGIPFNNSLNTADNTTNSTIYSQFGACDNRGLCENRANQTFYLYNTVPTLPATFNITSTHDQTPMIGWNVNATDKDGDNITYHIVASKTALGANDVMTEQKTLKPGDSNFFNTVIAWGTDNATDGYNNDTIYLRIWTTDNQSTANTSFPFNASFVLGDNLPDVTAVSMTDSAGYTLCPSCSLTPKSGTNASGIAIQINWTDVDNDCDSGANATSNIYLCAFQTGTCSDAAYNFTWLFETASRSGSSCWLNWSVNLTASNMTPQFWLTNASAANPYKLWVKASDGVGRRTLINDNEANTTWKYTQLSSINFTTSISLGGSSSIILDTWNNDTIGYAMTNFGNQILNISWNASDATAPASTWTVNGTNFEVDDDNAHNNGDAGNLIAVNLTRPALTDFFNTTTGLQRCANDLCNDPVLNEVLVTFWHIAPSAIMGGTYRSNITYYVNTFPS